MAEHVREDCRPARRGVLDMYVADLKRHPVLPRDERLVLARAYVQREVDHWMALLACPPAAVCALDALFALRKKRQGAPDEEDSKCNRGRPAPLSSLGETRAAQISELARNGVPSSAYKDLVCELVPALRLADGDRSWLAAAHEACVVELRRAATPESERFQAEIRATAKARIGARNAMVEPNLRLTWIHAKRYAWTKVPLEDLLQIGNLGLMRAVDTFDPERGWTFSTYAANWIRAYVKRNVDETAHTIRLPVHAVETIGRIKRAIVSFRTLYGRAPTAKEIADAADVEFAKVQKMLEVPGSVLSLDVPIGGDGSDGRTFLEDVVDERTPAVDDALALAFDRKLVREALTKLPKKLADILVLRFQDDQTLEEIGDKYGVSRERARHLERDALMILRREIDTMRPDAERATAVHVTGRKGSTVDFDARNRSVLELLRRRPMMAEEVEASELGLSHSQVAVAISSLANLGLIVRCSGRVAGRSLVWKVR